ncbi:MAG: FprA family A-type flavoprotein [Lachnospiraceae bacterium]|nr:FprA family A-type flavoprotein [Lachnospiraceae bacterium]
MKITESIRYIGVDDHETDLFEGHFDVPNGMAYNSYLILDGKTAVMDSVDARFSARWLSNLEEALEGRRPDYLIVQHMEPDHSGSIVSFMEAYPGAQIVSSAKAFAMMKNFFGTDFDGRRITAGEGSTLPLGTHTLRFVAAPMVHWPEVLFTYDETEKVLFSADAFGKFGALDVDDPEGWACEARRYYFGIVGKYGPQVQAVLKKLSGLPVEKILPLHGPVLTEDLGYYLDLYNTWSSYGTETEGVAVFYTSVYGHTKEAVLLLADLLRKAGCPKVAVSDLARCDHYEAVEDAFRYGRIVLATTTYNMEIFPYMREFLHSLAERNFRNRKIGLIENGSWAPVAARLMRGQLEGCKNLTFTDTTVRIDSALNEASRAQLQALAREILE